MVVALSLRVISLEVPDWSFWLLVVLVGLLVLALAYTNYDYASRLNSCVEGQLDDFVSVKCPEFNQYEFNQTKPVVEENLKDWEWCGDHWCYLKQ